MTRLEGVPQGRVGTHVVVATSPHADAVDDPSRLEFGEDPRHGAFGDPDGVGDLPYAGVGVLCDVDENVPVVAEEVPCGARWRCVR